jgi:predicted nucleic acid-binding protein
VSNGGPANEPSPSIDIVVDASVAVKWFVPETFSAEALRLLDVGIRRHIPILLHSEVAQTVWKKVYQRNEIASADGREILRALLVAPLEVHPVMPLVEPAFDVALITGRTVYDCIYLALAVALDCKLMTADRKFYNALRATEFAADVLWVADPI